jgi:hypothetical protein
MRTKALIVAAALAAGLASSMAQNVYSLNVVGYVNLNLVQGWNLVANQLDADGYGTNNTLASVFGDNMPINTQVFKFSGGAWGESDLYAGVWVAGGTMTVNPGEGVFISCPEAKTVTVVGNVMQGNLSTTVPNGYSVASSQVPQAGGLSTVMGYDVAANDQLFFWNKATQGYDTSALYLGGGLWVPEEPTVAVGDAFFISSTGGTWARNFTVAQ